MTIDSSPTTRLDKRQRRNARQVGGFVIAGAIGFGVDAGCLMLFAQNLPINLYVARILSFSVAVVVTWLLNSIFTFQSRESLNLRGFLRYLLTQTAGAFINISIFSLAIHESALMAQRPIFAVIFSSLAAMALNFNILKKFVYKRTETPGLHRQEER